METYHRVQHDGHDEVMDGDADCRPAMEQFERQDRFPRDFRFDQNEDQEQDGTGAEQTQDPGIRPPNFVLAHSGRLERHRDQKGTDKSSEEETAEKIDPGEFLTCSLFGGCECARGGNDVSDFEVDEGARNGQERDLACQRIFESVARALNDSPGDRRPIASPGCR